MAMRFLGLGGKATGLEADLKKITDAELIDVPDKDVLRGIVMASHDENDRREIMRHLNGCLSERSAYKWRRIHGGLVLLEQLLQKGAPALITETSGGHHFDLVQRLTFLEEFSYPDDRRVQHMVRQKASAMRKEWISSIQGVDVGDIDHDDSDKQVSSKTIPRKEAAPEPVAYRPTPSSKSKIVVNGLVSVGHRDETDSESDGEAERRRRDRERDDKNSRQNRGTRKLEERKRSVMDDSTDSDDSKGRSGGSRRRDDGHAPKPPAVAPDTNLLDTSPLVTVETNLLDM